MHKRDQELDIYPLQNRKKTNIIYAVVHKRLKKQICNQVTSSVSKKAT